MSSENEHLIEELRENLRRYKTNVASLKWLLYSLGDEPQEYSPDWDWRWPDGVSLDPVIEDCYQRLKKRRRLGPAISSKLSAFYQLLYDQPPDMATWANQLKQPRLFYVFMFQQLDDRFAAVEKLLTEIEGALNSRIV